MVKFSGALAEKAFVCFCFSKFSKYWWFQTKQFTRLLEVMILYKQNRDFFINFFFFFFYFLTKLYFGIHAIWICFLWKCIGLAGVSTNLNVCIIIPHNFHRSRLYHSTLWYETCMYTSENNTADEFEWLYWYVWQVISMYHSITWQTCVCPHTYSYMTFISIEWNQPEYWRKKNTCMIDYYWLQCHFFFFSNLYSDKSQCKIHWT